MFAVRHVIDVHDVDRLIDDIIQIYLHLIRRSLFHIHLVLVRDVNVIHDALVQVSAKKNNISIFAHRNKKSTSIRC